MKRFIIIILVSLSGYCDVKAINRYVDPNLSSSNGTTLFNSITSAVNAAQNGDKIFIVQGVYIEPTLVISKSLTFLSQNQAGIITLNSNITINGFPGMKLTFLGFNLGLYSVNSSPISSGTAANRAILNFIDCQMTNLIIDNNYYELNCISSKILNQIVFRFGNIVLTQSRDLYLRDEPLSNLSNSKILIVADSVSNRLEIRNDDYPVTVANCQIKDLLFFKWNHLLTNINYIRNNRFSDLSHIMFSHNPPAYNIEFSSNQMISNTHFLSNGNCCGGCYDGGDGCWGFSPSGSIFPNPAVGGFFRWRYNGIDLPVTRPSAGQALNLDVVIGLTGLVDTGDPNHEYYDIDLTVNDRGINGGPYGSYNYYPISNPNGSKAFIFDLDIPADLFTGQSVTIKAKGYHKN